MTIFSSLEKVSSKPPSRHQYTSSFAQALSPRQYPETDIQ
jgi:hypothetical protein